MMAGSHSSASLQTEHADVAGGIDMGGRGGDEWHRPYSRSTREQLLELIEELRCRPSDDGLFVGQRRPLPDPALAVGAAVTKTRKRRRLPAKLSVPSSLQEQPLPPPVCGWGQVSTFIGKALEEEPPPLHRSLSAPAARSGRRESTRSFEESGFDDGLPMDAGLFSWAVAAAAAVGLGQPCPQGPWEDEQAGIPSGYDIAPAPPISDLGQPWGQQQQQGAALPDVDISLQHWSQYIQDLTALTQLQSKGMQGDGSCPPQMQQQAEEAQQQRPADLGQQQWPAGQQAQQWPAGQQQPQQWPIEQQPERPDGQQQQRLSPEQQDEEMCLAELWHRMANDQSPQHPQSLPHGTHQQPGACPEQQQQQPHPQMPPEAVRHGPGWDVGDIVAAAAPHSQQQLGDMLGPAVCVEPTDDDMGWLLDLLD